MCRDPSALHGSTLTTDCVRSISPVTVFFSSLSLAGASVNRNNSELKGAFAKPNCRVEEEEEEKERLVRLATAALAS